MNCCSKTTNEDNQVENTDISFMLEACWKVSVGMLVALPPETALTFYYFFMIK